MSAHSFVPVFLLVCTVTVAQDAADRVPSETTPPRRYELLQNGSFDEVHIGIPTPLGAPDLDGRFWAGGEDSTVPDPEGGRILRLAGDRRVFQRVGVPPRYSGSAELALRVLVPDDRTTVLVTLAEAPVHVTQLRWGTGGHDAPRWSFSEVAGGQESPLVQSPGGDWRSLVDTHASLSAGRGGVTVAVIPEELIVRYAVSIEGPVRILSRPMYLNGDPATFSVMHVDGSTRASTTLDEFTLQPSDTDGNHHEVRVADVAAGDELVFRIERLTELRDSTVYWPLQIEFEGRSVVYAIGQPGAPRPPSTSTRHVVPVDLAPSAVGRQIGRRLSAGPDFVQHFSAAPAPPLEIELGVVSDSGGAVELDDVECTARFDHVEERELGDKILAEYRWMIENFKIPQDRGNHVENQPSPWAVGRLRTNGEVAPFLPDPDAGNQIVGDEPLAFDQFLAVGWDQAVYDDFYEIRERSLRTPRTRPAELLFSRYTVDGDAFLPVSLAATLDDGEPVLVDAVVAIDDLLTEWERTHDPDYVLAALPYARMMVSEGVIDEREVIPSIDPLAQDPWNLSGLIHGGGYRITDGLIADREAAYVAFGKDPARYPTPACALLRLCIAGRELSEELLDPKVPVTELTLWFDTARTAITRAAELHGNSPRGLPEGMVWNGDDWQQYHGQFNDLFGYQGRGAVESWQRLVEAGFDEPSVYAWDIPGMVATLRDDIAHDGSEHFLPQWAQATERSGFLASDQSRAWPAYFELSRSPDVPLEDRQDYVDQLRDAAYTVFRHMHHRGVWTNTACDWFQTTDATTSGNGFGPGPVDEFAGGIGRAIAALRAADPGSKDIPALVDRLNAMFERNREWFRADHGYFADLAARDANDQSSTRRIEWRSLNAFVRAMDALEPGLPPRPTATIAPGSYDPPDRDGAFELTVVHPELAGDRVALEAAVFERTAVYLWSEDASGRWRRQRLWPEAGVGAAAFAGVDPVTGTGKLTVSASHPIFPAGDYKLVLVTWDSAGRHWSRDTSRQE